MSYNHPKLLAVHLEYSHRFSKLQRWVASCYDILSLEFDHRSNPTKMRCMDARKSYLTHPFAYVSARLAVTSDIPVRNKPDCLLLPIYGERGEEGTCVERTVHNALTVDCPDPPSGELSEPTKVDDAYVDRREAIDLSRILGASL